MAVSELVLEEFLVPWIDMVPDRVARAGDPRVVCHTHVGQAQGVGLGVHAGDPVVHPPVREDDRVVYLEYLLMRPVNEVVGENAVVSLGTRGADHPEIHRSHLRCGRARFQHMERSDDARCDGDGDGD